MSTSRRPLNSNPEGSRESTRSLLKVLSVNVWGLHWLGSVRIRERLSYIVHELKKYDIVGLQEVWKAEDYSYLVEQLKDVLPHHTYLHSGIIGSGLCIFSRHPLMESHTHLYTVCGSMGHFLDGELFSGKGILMCRVLTPSGVVSVYNTHLDPRNRDSQCCEMYSFVQQSRGGAPVILLGDFNTKPSQGAYAFLMTSLDLHDVFADDPQDTCDLTSNIYTVRRMTPKRIDYIFFSNPRTAPSLKMTLQSKRLAVTGPIPGKSFPYTDHEGVEACFRLEQQPEGDLTHNNNAARWPQPQDKASAIKVFQKMDSRLRSKLPLKVSVSAGLTCYFAMSAALLPFSIIMSCLVYPTLAPHGLGWTSHVCAAAAGGIVLFLVIYTMVKSRTRLALDANLARINTVLTHLQRTSECDTQSV